MFRYALGFVRMRDKVVVRGRTDVLPRIAGMTPGCFLPPQLHHKQASPPLMDMDDGGDNGVRSG
jgi:hypothetical protein